MYAQIAKINTMNNLKDKVAIKAQIMELLQKQLGHILEAKVIGEAITALQQQLKQLEDDDYDRQNQNAK